MSKKCQNKPYFHFWLLITIDCIQKMQELDYNIDYLKNKKILTFDTQFFWVLYSILIAKYSLFLGVIPNTHTQILTFTELLTQYPILTFLGMHVWERVTWNETNENEADRIVYQQVPRTVANWWSRRRAIAFRSSFWID